MTNETKEADRPPQPPEMERQFQFHRLQLVGVPLLMLLPLLATFNLFGESFQEVRATSQQLEMRVSYPNRIRYQMPEVTEIAIRNVSTQAIPTVTLAVDNSYISSLSQVTFTPDVKEITEAEHRVELTDIGAGETRIITVDFQAAGYGSHSGDITASIEGSSQATVRVDTFIFP